MSNPRFPILGKEIPPLLGRTRIMQRIWNDLTKPTPSNLSLIGPRFMGKTVIMNALAQRVANEASPFEFVLYWHLGHVAPASDEAFIAQHCDILRDSLARSTAETSEYRQHLEEHSFSNLSEVADYLDEEGRAILMLWDGFDKPLGQGRLSGHLWDQMRTVFKDTYVLIDAIHNFRNRAQHPDGQTIHLGVAVAAIMACLELLLCLERELR